MLSAILGGCDNNISFQSGVSGPFPKISLYLYPVILFQYCLVIPKWPKCEKKSKLILPASLILILQCISRQSEHSLCCTDPLTWGWGTHESTLEYTNTNITATQGLGQKLNENYVKWVVFNFFGSLNLRPQKSMFDILYCWQILILSKFLVS